jgi:hypothetical protein
MKSEYVNAVRAFNAKKQCTTQFHNPMTINVDVCGNGYVLPR